MKAFIKKTIIVTFPALFFIAFCEIAHRIPENDYKYKYNWMRANASTVQVLIVGSSHTYDGIDPALFTISAFNASHLSQDIRYGRFIFNKFISQMDSLEYLIIPVSYFTPFYQMEKSVTSHRVKGYHIYYHCLYHPFNPKYHLEIYNGIDLESMTKMLMGIKKRQQCTERGFRILSGLKENKLDIMLNGYSEARKHIGFSNWSSFPKNKKWMVDIIKQCRQKGVQVILLSTPTHETYRNHLDSLQLQKTIQFCDDLQNNFQNVTYLNYFEDPRFLEQDYYNSDHLNRLGAVKLSTILNEYLLKDRAGRRIPYNNPQ